MVQPDKYNLNYLTENWIYTRMYELFHCNINILYLNKKRVLFEPLYNKYLSGLLRLFDSRNCE